MLAFIMAGHLIAASATKSASHERTNLLSCEWSCRCSVEQLFYNTY